MGYVMNNYLRIDDFSLFKNSDMANGQKIMQIFPTLQAKDFSESRSLSVKLSKNFSKSFFDLFAN